MLERKDSLIMDFKISKGASKEDLLSMSRVRGLLCIIFISDIVTADGKCLEGFSITRTSSMEHASKYNLPKEATIQDDWMIWIQFWKQHTVGTFELSTPLGEWIHPIHRV